MKMTRGHFVLAASTVVVAVTVTGAAVTSAQVAAAPVHRAATGPASTVSYFRSPSGNINCVLDNVDGTEADCVTRSSSWQKMPEPGAGCATRTVSQNPDNTFERVCCGAPEITFENMRSDKSDYSGYGTLPRAARPMHRVIAFARTPGRANALTPAA